MAEVLQPPGTGRHRASPRRCGSASACCCGGCARSGPTASSACRRPRRWPGWTAPARPRSSALAKLEQISPQSMGATLAALEARGLVERRPTRRTAGGPCCRSPAPGQQVLRDKRNARVAQLAQALSAAFTPAEISQLMAAAPLLERLAAEHLMRGVRGHDAHRPLSSGSPWPTPPPPCSWPRSTAPSSSSRCRPSSAASTWTRWRRATSATCCG